MQPKDQNLRRKYVEQRTTHVLRVWSFLTAISIIILVIQMILHFVNNSLIPKSAIFMNIIASIVGFVFVLIGRRKKPVLHFFGFLFIFGYFVHEGFAKKEMKYKYNGIQFQVSAIAYIISTCMLSASFILNLCLTALVFLVGNII